jgi:hypothetical protein
LPHLTHKKSKKGEYKTKLSLERKGEKEKALKKKLKMPNH